MLCSLDFSGTARAVCANTKARILSMENCIFADTITKNLYYDIKVGASGGVVCWSTMLQAGRPRVPFPMRSLDFQLT
jgi:hypothetical protein